MTVMEEKAGLEISSSAGPEKGKTETTISNEGGSKYEAGPCSGSASSFT